MYAIRSYYDALEYAGRALGRILLQLLAIVVLAWIARRARSLLRSEAATGGAAHGLALQALAHPWAAAFFASLTLFNAVHPAAPMRNNFV